MGARCWPAQKRKGRIEKEERDAGTRKTGIEDFQGLTSAAATISQRYCTGTLANALELTTTGFPTVRVPVLSKMMMFTYSVRQIVRERKREWAGEGGG